MRLATMVLLAGWLCAEPQWVTLFDGVSTTGWRAPLRDEFPDVCWRVEGGLMHPVKGSSMADLWSKSRYRNFDLEFEFALAPGANGGIKYLVQSGVAFRVRGGKFLYADRSSPEPGDVYIEGTNGLEFQIVDDEHREAQDPKRRSGAMYSLVAPSDPPPITPGEFHRGRIVVQGNRIEHYLNGRRVLQVTLGSAEMEGAWDACRRRDIQRFRDLKVRETPIVITHHGSLVRYRNIRIRELAGAD